MLTFMSHPETTCSSSHLRACSSMGKCWLVVFRKPSWPYSCGGRPGAAPLHPPKHGSSPRGCFRVLGGMVPLGLDPPGRQGGSGEDLSSRQRPLGQSPNHSLYAQQGLENARARLVSGWLR